MIDTSPSSIRVFAIIVLSIVWLYLFVEQLAIQSVKKDKRK
jgi:uncharacterized membrane protein|tara:strand:- start:375 stop:497 length:123 start_codon:yes stop_codon:yes gene_type:complete